MKTVIDAVNEFKGEIDTGVEAFVCNQSSGSIKVWYNDTFVDLATPQWTPLCCAKEFNDLVSQMETNFSKREQSYSDYKFDYHLSPEPTLTYTQAMADNGVLPSVGMECLYLDSTTNNYIKCLVMYISEWAIVLKQAGEGYGKDVELAKHINDVTIKPLTPPKTDDEKFMDALVEYNLCTDDSDWKEHLLGFIKSGELHGVSFQPLTVEAK
jgi:hypothetical protein